MTVRAPDTATSPHLSNVFAKGVRKSASTVLASKIRRQPIFSAFSRLDVLAWARCCSQIARTVVAWISAELGLAMTARRLHVAAGYADPTRVPKK
jgi:hypothetical protein